MKPKITLNIRSKYFNIIDVMPTDYTENDMDSTLRDIALFLEMGCGHGVQWQLAYELSKRLNIIYDDIALKLGDICEEYSKLTEAKLKPKKKYNKYKTI
jgi:hypothetical protein